MNHFDVNLLFLLDTAPEAWCCQDQYVLEVCLEPPLESEVEFGAAFRLVLMCDQTELFLCCLSSACSLLKLGTVQYCFVSGHLANQLINARFGKLTWAGRAYLCLCILVCQGKCKGISLHGNGLLSHAVPLGSDFGQKQKAVSCWFMVLEGWDAAASAVRAQLVLAEVLRLVV